MPKAKRTTAKDEPTPAVTTAVNAPAEAAIDVPAPKGERSAYTVLDSAGATVREYSTEKHGPEAFLLAAEYAKKIGGSVK